MKILVTGSAGFIGFHVCKKLIEKGKKIAAHALEAAEGDIEFAEGNFSVTGTDKSMNIAEVAFNAYVPHSYPEGLELSLIHI